VRQRCDVKGPDSFKLQFSIAVLSALTIGKLPIDTYQIEDYCTKFKADARKQNKGEKP